MFHVELGNPDGRMFHVEQRELREMLLCSIWRPRETIRAPPVPNPVISLARYTALLTRPGIRSAIVASIAGRLPIGITGLAILLSAQEAMGSFASGGLCAAAYVMGLGAVAPLFGRIIDRFGPRWILRCCLVAFPASLAALVYMLQSNVSPWIACATAACSGAFFPPITVCIRTFLRQSLKDEALLATAYSLESVLIELIFILGPALVALLTAVASPMAAVLFAAATGCAGTLLFLRSAAVREWRIEPRGHGSVFGPLARPGFPSLLLVILCYACAFGLVEIGATAYAREIESPALAGLLLGVMSIGSAVGGLIYGSRNWRLPLAQQFPLTLAVMGLGILPLAWISGAWPFTLWCVMAGVAMAPALIIQSMLVARNSRPDQATEAFTWSSTGLLAGVGAGLSLGGALLEHARSPAPFTAAAALAIAGSLLALARRSGR